MVTARKGDPIVCSHGHVAGHVLNDVADTDQITPEADIFDLDDAARTITANNDGHECSQCGERITRLHNGLYQIRTAQGWFGRTD